MTTGQNNKRCSVLRPRIMQRKHHNTNVFNLGRVQKSIFDGITLIYNQSFHASWHALHHVFHVLLLGDFMPLLGYKPRLVTIHLPFDLIPEVFNGVQVWRLGWLWQFLDLVVFHPHFDWPGCVARSIVLLEKPILRVGEHCQSRGKQAWFTRSSQRQICLIPALLKHPRSSLILETLLFPYSKL